MPLIDAATLVRHAHRNRYCVVQINTNGGTYDITRAIVEVAEQLNSPVILGAYEANLGYRGYDYAAMQMRFFAERAKVPIAIHLDHGGSVDACQKAIDAGFTSVMIDGSHTPIEKNIDLVKSVVAIAQPHGVSVEAEVGELQKLAPDGSVERIVPVPTAQVTKCAFGGPDLTTLYITTAAIGRDPHIDVMAGHLFKVETDVRGLQAHIFEG